MTRCKQPEGKKYECEARVRTRREAKRNRGYRTNSSNKKQKRGREKRMKGSNERNMRN